jgi:hypothetical protein
MPYYIFALGTDQPPRRLADASGYRDAKAILGALREAAAKSQTQPVGAHLRMLFAADERAAVQLLTQAREPDPALDAEDD